MAGGLLFENAVIFDFYKFTPAGQDFSFNATMQDDDFQSLIEDVENFYNAYDPNEEAYIWLDHSGHGRNGAGENRIYTSMVNNGNFYGNMLTVELAQRLFNDHLRICIMGISEHNAIRGDLYRMRKNILRGKMNADYTVGHWRMGAELATPYCALNISGPFYVKKRMKTHFYAAYDRGNLRLEAGVSNPFGKYWIETSHADYPCFDLQTKTFSVRQGRSFSLKAVYNFCYGKKTESKRPAIETIMNSAIMRAK